MTGIKSQFLIFSVLLLAAYLLLCAAAFALPETAMPSVTQNLRQGDRYMEQREYTLALQAYLDAIEHAPGNERAYQGAGAALRGLGRSADADNMEALYGK